MIGDVMNPAFKEAMRITTTRTANHAGIRMHDGAVFDGGVGHSLIEDTDAYSVDDDGYDDSHAARVQASSGSRAMVFASGR